MNLKIDKELKELIPPLAEDEIKQLENNLLNEGWRDNERIVTWNNTIVDGHNRYSVCTKHNIPFKIQEKEFADKNSVILWMIDNQLGRRNIPDYARVELNLRKEDILKPIAKENQGKRTDLVPELAQSNMGRVREKIAEVSKVSHGTVDKVKFIRDNADEETKSKLRSGNKELSINKVYQNLKAQEKRQKALESVKDAPKLEATEKKYKIILADPPWKYFAGGNKNQSIHYPNMEIEEIKNLPVSKLADDDCILFMWVTFPILPEVFSIMEAWGFRYATVGFNWVKRQKKGDGWFFGLGNWTRSNSELCLIGVKGHPIRQSASISQVIDTPIEEHSKKPDCVRDKIVELCGDIPRIELFARQKVEGWDVWGNEIK